MPARTLETVAVMYTIAPEALEHNGIDWSEVPGALHAAEHAAIGLLPLVASCDRGDIGGLSTAVGPDTGLPTVFVYDGYPGGAGFAERGFRQAATWLSATADAIEACECPNGCPSCVQSPKCGNGNDPLDKHAAVRVLRLVLSELSGDGKLVRIARPRTPDSFGTRTTRRTYASAHPRRARTAGPAERNAARGSMSWLQDLGLARCRLRAVGLPSTSGRAIRGRGPRLGFATSRMHPYSCAMGSESLQSMAAIASGHGDATGADGCV